MGRNRLLEQGQCRGVGNHPKGHSPSQGCGSHPSDRRQTGHCLKQGGDGKGMVSTGVNFNPKYFCTSSRSVCRSCSPAPTDEESDIWTGLPSVRRRFFGPVIMHHPWLIKRKVDIQNSRPFPIFWGWKRKRLPFDNSPPLSKYPVFPTPH